MKFNPQKLHRCSIHLKEYNYIAPLGGSQTGAYFVTIVTWQREMLFCEIVREEWDRTAVVRRNVDLGEYAVMPNHFHGILVFIDDGAHTVGATRRVAPMKTTLPTPH